MAEKLTEGWTWLTNSRKWHYFVGKESLCKKFMVWVTPDYEQGNDDSSDNCVGCKRALLKKIEKEAQE